jgi:hypothetical protein
LSIASNIQWYALIPHKAYSFITTLFLGPFDDVITKFYCIIIYIRKFESLVQIANRWAPWKISNGAENSVLQALQFQKMVVCCKLPGGESISHDAPNECFVEDQFNIIAESFTFNGEYIVINVLKAFAPIISMCYLQLSI